MEYQYLVVFRRKNTLLINLHKIDLYLVFELLHFD